MIHYPEAANNSFISINVGQTDFGVGVVGLQPLVAIIHKGGLESLKTPAKQRYGWDPTSSYFRSFGGFALFSLTICELTSDIFGVEARQTSCNRGTVASSRDGPAWVHFVSDLTDDAKWSLDHQGLLKPNHPTLLCDRNLHLRSGAAFAPSCISARASAWLLCPCKLRRRLSRVRTPSPLREGRVLPQPLYDTVASGGKLKS